MRFSWASAESVGRIAKALSRFAIGFLPGPRIVPVIKSLDQLVNQI